MKKLLMYSCLVLIAGCSKQQIVNVECSEDDTITFIAFNVTDVVVKDGGVILFRSNDGDIVRRMVENETCKRADYPIPTLEK